MTAWKPFSQRYLDEPSDAAGGSSGYMDDSSGGGYVDDGGIRTDYHNVLTKYVTSVLPNLKGFVLYGLLNPY